MDIKFRLRHLVNKECNFYPNKKNLGDRSEVINRYDSDEEEVDSELEEGNDLVHFTENHTEKIPLNNDENIEHCSTAKKEIDPHTKYSNNLNLTFSSNKNKIKLEFSEEDFLDVEIINNLEGIDFKDEECLEESINTFLSNLTNRENYLDELEKLLFFSQIYEFFVHKFSNYCLMKVNNKNKKNETIDRENVNDIFDLKIKLTFLVKIMTNSTIIINKIFSSVLKIFTNFADIKVTKYVRILNYILSASTNLMDLKLNNFEISKNFDLEFISHLIKIISICSDNLAFCLKCNEESELLSHNLKNIFLNFNLMFNKKLFYFNTEEKKNMLNFSFKIIKKNEFVHTFIPLIEILCNIIKEESSEDFINKFIDNLILFFLEFLNNQDFPEIKFYILSNKIIYAYRNYFGIYKSFNNDTISLFTFLIMKFFTSIYNSDVKPEIFNKVFERFVVKIFETKKNNLLLLFYCLSSEILKIKFNPEFSIALPMLTNLFLLFSNGITNSEIEINGRKFFLNLFNIIVDAILSDFSLIKDHYLCLSKSKDNHFCECFSCSFVNRDIITSKNYFKCSLCKYQTNLSMKIAKTEKDLANQICVLCSTKHYLEDVTHGIDLSSQLNLNESKLEIIQEYSKDQKETSNSEFYDKFPQYQESLYLNSFNFVQTTILNFILCFSKNQNAMISGNIDESFRTFIKILISDGKFNISKSDFYENISKLYFSQKENIINTVPLLSIDPWTINYFSFFFFYVNFLFAAHYRLLDILISDSSSNVHWFLRLKSLKILEKFLIFEGEDQLFKNFNQNVLSILISDLNLNIKEYSLEILFKLFKFKKLSKNELINILYENIEETSFIIRKRIIKALIGLLVEDKDLEDKENFKTINFIFLNKLLDKSESSKLKNLIYDFYFFVFNNFAKKEFFVTEIIKIFLEILKENEDQLFDNRNHNIFLQQINNLFQIMVNEKKLKNSCLVSIADFLFSNYVNSTHLDNSLLVQALILFKIISSISPKSLLLYFQDLIDFLVVETQDESKVKKDNLIKSIVCEIFVNVLNECEVKRKLILSLENYLLVIIISKPTSVMTTAIDCYTKILSKGIVNFEKIISLTAKNYYFLITQIKNLKTNFDEVPLQILSKSINLLSYLVYLSDTDDLNKIFSFLLDKSDKFLNENENENFICENIFTIFSSLVKNHPKNSIKFRAFEALGYFWIRFPHKLLNSKELIEYLLQRINDDEEKLIVIMTFTNFFEKISQKIKYSKENNFDFGGIHLFFECFINKICNFITNENNSIIRLHAIHLVKLIIDLGNVNAHLVLPYVFSAMFDYVDEIRHISSSLLHSIVRISKEKFFGFLKENLKMSFNFQKKLFTLSRFINSFVKNKLINEFEEFETQNENIFELFFYKIGKSNKDENFTKKLLNKLVSIFINSKKDIDSDESISYNLNKFEFYEFVANLIADFKFSNNYEILSVFEFLGKEYQTDIIIFQSKWKEYKDSSIVKIDRKLLLHFLNVATKVSLFKFLFAKYENLERYENVIKKNSESFFISIKNGEIEIQDGKGNNKTGKDSIVISKEFKNIKFCQFFESTLILFKKLFKIGDRKNFNLKDKKEICDLMRSLKDYEKLQISEVRMAALRYRKKLTKDDVSSANELLFSLLYCRSEPAPSRSASKKKTILNTEKRQSLDLNNRQKGNKRTSLIELDDNYVNTKPQARTEKKVKKENINKRNKK